MPRIDPETDPALVMFLILLERDMQSRPHALVPLSSALAARMNAATEAVQIDLDAPIDGEVAL